MKVLLAHNFYQSSSPSGEDAVYVNEADILRSREVEIIRYEKHNDDISGPVNRIKATFDLVWSKKTYHEVSALIKKEQPDIAHFHNIWYMISPSAYYACKDAGVPVVQTLHNFRMFCANGLLLRNGRVCEGCIGKLPWRGAAYGCFRNSRLYSTPVVAAEIIHGLRKTWTNAIDAYISLTDFGKQKFIECGLPESKIYVKPNFLFDPPNFLSASQDYAIFIGRLSQEKGINVLLDAFRRLNYKLPLKVVGAGPQFAELNRNQLPDVEFVGRKSHAECMQLLKGARFLVLPSVCYENFPMTIVEAFACGKPIIASRLGAMAEIVEHGKTGLLFQTGDSRELADSLTTMISDTDLCIRMGRNARLEFENRYTAERNFDQLVKIYGHVLQNRA